jgi:hypothetical protein
VYLTERGHVSGGDLSGDGGLLLLRQVDRHLGLSRATAAAIPNPRDPKRIRHSLRHLLAQSLYGLCCGYKYLNDHQALRDDVLMQAAVGRDEALASAPTFGRLDNRATRAQAWALSARVTSHDRWSLPLQSRVIPRVPSSGFRARASTAAGLGCAGYGSDTG